MTGKRCTDCRYTKGIGYDFWCGEGHTEYEVFGAETNCPYYEYHDWSKGIPSKTAKRFTGVEIIYTPNLPVEILNEKTNEKEVFHMIQKGNTLFVSEELYKSLDKRYGNG